jgi:hypothetical protein
MGAGIFGDVSQEEGGYLSTSFLIQSDLMAVFVDSSLQYVDRLLRLSCEFCIVIRPPWSISAHFRSSATSRWLLEGERRWVIWAGERAILVDDSVSHSRCMD